jgi:toxin ParE1/3/4
VPSGGAAIRVRLSGPAVADLKEIADWIADRAGEDVGEAYVRRMEAYCRRLTHFPNRGSPRDDLEAGLRSIPFQGRATIYYRVEADRVRILRILAFGRDPKREFAKS